jgi:hypothetical protein
VTAPAGEAVLGEGFAPNPEAAAISEALDDTQARGPTAHESVGLIESSGLTDDDLAAISGMGIMPAAPANQTVGVVLWDERPTGPPVVSHHSDAGHGGHQVSTVTFSAR